MRLWGQQHKNRFRCSGIAFFSIFTCSVIFFVCVNIYIGFAVDGQVYDQVNESFVPVDAVIILGAMVYSDGRLSSAVQERADDAIALRKSGKARKILVSGDNRTKYYDEVTTIKNYLFSQHIPQEAIFLDFAGLDTYDSMYRAQYIFQVQSLLIPTQAFHVQRAVFLAKELGIDAYGVTTHTYALPQLRRLYIREFFARGKAWRDIVADSGPRHLGEEIPITGPSNS